MTHITANLAKMFSELEPWDCSNNAATMGDSVGRITWANATTIAAASDAWLESPLADAVAGMKEWAAECGAWEPEEIALWSDEDTLALLVQNIASDLRMLGSDDADLETCVAKYETTNWDKEPEYPQGSYYLSTADNTPMVEYYTGI